MGFPMGQPYGLGGTPVLNAFLRGRMSQVEGSGSLTKDSLTSRAAGRTPEAVTKSRPLDFLVY